MASIKGSRGSIHTVSLCPHVGGSRREVWAAAGSSGWSHIRLSHTHGCSYSAVVPLSQNQHACASSASHAVGVQARSSLGK